MGFTPIYGDAVLEMIDSLELQKRLRAPAYALAMGLLTRAARTPRNFLGEALQVGDILCPIRELADGCYLSLQTVRTVIQHMHGRFLTQRSTRFGNVLSICNFGTYVACPGEVNTRTNTAKPEIQHRSNTTPNGEGVQLPLHARALEGEERDGAEAKPVNGSPTIVSRDHSTPLNLTDPELLPALPDHDLDALMAAYARGKERHRRRHLLDVQVRRALEVLARDPGITPQLRQDQMLALVGQWMESGIPRHPHQLWHLNAKFDGNPQWECCLIMAERRQQQAAERQAPQTDGKLSAFIDSRRSGGR